MYIRIKMGIETIFFISLGITFVLLIALVYHFYNKFSMLDIRISKLVEAMNMLVTETGQELENTKEMIDSIGKKMNLADMENVDMNNFIHPYSTTENMENIEINLGEKYDDIHKIYPNLYTSSNVYEKMENPILQLNLVDDDDNDSEYDSDDESDDESDESDESDSEPQYDSEYNSKIVVSDNEDFIETIVVHKLEVPEEIHLDQMNMDIKPIYTDEDATDYRKMNVEHLRAMVIQRGTSEKDAKKMKKNELISILEEK